MIVIEKSNWNDIPSVDNQVSYLFCSKNEVFMSCVIYFKQGHVEIITKITMTDYNEEQRNEIEALESIYPEELKSNVVSPLSLTGTTLLQHSYSITTDLSTRNRLQLI